jgi:MoaA/NifB/PqqE/SkfB family radical SAM enzyme
MKYVLETTADILSSVVSSDASMRYAYDYFTVQKRNYNHPAIVVADAELYFYGLMTESDVLKYVSQNPNADLESVRLIDVCNKTPNAITQEDLERHLVNDTDPFENLPPQRGFMPVLNAKGQFLNFVFNKKHYMPAETEKYIAIDIIDSCQLSCVHCPRGLRNIPNTNGEMSLSLFEEIVIKAKDNGYTYFDLINFTEAFLKKDLYKYMELLREHGIPRRTTSSNFSFDKIPNFDEFLDSGFTRLFVSVSGFTQETYEKYHKGGNLEWVKRNLEYAAKYKRDKKIAGDIIVRYLSFDYNKNEIDLFKKFTQQLGLTFEIRNGGVSNMQTYNPKGTSDDEITARFLRSYHTISGKKRNLEVCSSFGMMALDYKGDAYLCCSVPTHACLKIGNFFRDDVESLLINKWLHPYCQLCRVKKTVPLPKFVKEEIIRRIA